MIYQITQTYHTDTIDIIHGFVFWPLNPENMLKEELAYSYLPPVVH